MNKEILLVAEAVSNEKGVDKEVIFEAIEAALASATRKRHREDIDARVAIDRETGDYETFRRWEVVDDDTEELELPAQQMHLSEAREMDPSAEVGGSIEEPMESVQFGRIAAQKAVASRNPQAIEPGLYTAVLEPSAVSDLVPLLSGGLNARTADANGSSSIRAPRGSPRPNSPRATSSLRPKLICSHRSPKAPLRFHPKRSLRQRLRS